jgi:hypothetical protein
LSDSIVKLQSLLDRDCKIEKTYPNVHGSDAETNIITVEVRCPDGQLHKIRAYREEANVLREFIRTREILDK